MQTFFFIPLMGLQTCIVPVLSFNYATKSYGRCRETMKDSYLFSCGFMLIGGVCFVFFPVELLRIFSDSSEVIAIGKTAFPISEVLVGVTGMGVYWRTINGWKNSRK